MKKYLSDISESKRILEDNESIFLKFVKANNIEGV